MTVFTIESLKEIRGHVYVLAKQKSPGPFVVSEGATLGGVALAPWLEVPRAFQKYRKLRSDLFAFCLDEATSADSLQIDEEVVLECPETSLRCPQCGARVPRLSQGTEKPYQEAVAFRRNGRTMEAIRALVSEGMTVREAKAVVLHISNPDSECHRCGAVVMPSSHSICPKCHALNLAGRRDAQPAGEPESP